MISSCLKGANYRVMYCLSLPTPQKSRSAAVPLIWFTRWQHPALRSEPYFPMSAVPTMHCALFRTFEIISNDAVKFPRLLQPTSTDFPPFTCHHIMQPSPPNPLIHPLGTHLSTSFKTTDEINCHSHSLCFICNNLQLWNDVSLIWFLWTWGYGLLRCFNAELRVLQSQSSLNVNVAMRVMKRPALLFSFCFPSKENNERFENHRLEKIHKQGETLE